MTRPRVLVLVAAALVAAGGLAAALGLRGGSQHPSAAPVGAARVALLLRGIQQQGAALGRPGAPVTLVEFADLQCPYCADWARNALPGVVGTYVRTGKVRVVFAGMAFLGPDSETALRTALAAGEQRRLWNVLELLYENQGTENAGWVTDGLLGSIGRSVDGLDVQAMLDARRSAAVDRMLADATALATRLGIRSTPSFAVGRTAGPLQVVPVRSLDTAGIAPALDAALRQ